MTSADRSSPRAADGEAFERALRGEVGDPPRPSDGEPVETTHGETMPPDAGTHARTASAARDDSGPPQAGSNGSPAGRTPRTPPGNTSVAPAVESPVAPAVPPASTSGRPDTLTRDIAAALAVGDDAAIEKLAESDPFAVSGRLAAATDLVVADPETDDFTAFGTSVSVRNNLEARQTSLAYALRFQQQLDSAGVGDPSRPLSSLAEARALATSAAGDDAYAVNDAMALARTHTSIARETLGLTPRDLPHRQTLVESLATGIGAVLDDARRTVDPFLPTAWSLGYTFGARMPVSGAATMTMPIGPHGVNSPLDLTSTDGTPANGISVFVRPNPRADGIMLPKDTTPFSASFGFTPEIANLPGFLSGERPLVGPEGPMKNYGVGGIATRSQGIVSTRALGGKIPFVSLGLSGRRYLDGEDVRSAFAGSDQDVLDAWAAGEAAEALASSLPPVRLPDGSELNGAIELGARIGGFAGDLTARVAERLDEAGDAVMADGRPDEVIEAVVSLLPPWLPGLPRESTPPLVPSP